MNEIFKLSDKEINYALFGMLLGDGWIANRTNNNKNKQLAIEHSAKQTDYVRWKEELFKFWGIYRMSEYGRWKQTTYGPLQINKVIADIPDQRHFLSFNRFYDDNGKKLISEYVMRRITPLGLLFWFLDDGHLNINRRLSKAAVPKYDGYRISREATISTYSFSVRDHEIAIQYLAERFGIDAKLRWWNPTSKKSGPYPKLYMGPVAFRKYFDVVREYLPYLPDTMKYKFDMKYSSLRANEIDYQAYNLPISAVYPSEMMDNDIVHSDSKEC